MNDLKHRKRWGWTAAGLFLGLAIAIQWSGSDELQRWKQAQEAKGERLVLEAIHPATTPSARGFAEEFPKVVGRLAPSTVLPGQLQLMRPTAPGYARVLSRESELAGRGRLGPTWTNLSRTVATNAAALHALHQLLATPVTGSAVEVTNVAWGPPEWRSSRRSAAQWLSAAAVDALHRNNLDEALNHVHALLAVVRLSRNDPSLWSQLVGVGVGGMAIDATWEALQAPGWTEPKLARLQSDWEQTTLLDGLPLGLEIERANMIGVFEEARTNRHSFVDLQRSYGLMSTNAAAQAFQEHVAAPFWRAAWSRQDELAWLRGIQPLLDLVRQDPTAQDWVPTLRALDAARGEQDRRRGWFDRIRPGLGGILQRNWNGVFAVGLRHEQLRHFAISAIAIRRYQARHGRPPTHLDDLFPDFLARTPRDLHDGQVLRYEVNPDQSTVLHSVGINRVDDDVLGDDLAWPLPGWPKRLEPPANAGAAIAWEFEAVSTWAVAAQLAGELALPLRYDPTVTNGLNEPVSIRFAETTMWRALEAVLANQGLVVVSGPKHRLPCVIKDPYPFWSYYDDVTDEPSHGELLPLIVFDGVPYVDALRNLARAAGWNFQFDPRVTRAPQAEVSKRLENASVEDVFKQLVRERGFSVLRSKASGILLVTLPPTE